MSDIVLKTLLSVKTDTPPGKEANRRSSIKKAILPEAWVVARHKLVVIPLLVIILAWMPTAAPLKCYGENQSASDNGATNLFDHLISNDWVTTETGVLDPVVVEHIATASGLTQYQSARTDVDSMPTSEVYHPSGAPVTYYSADCSGGYFLVGAGGSADFGTPEGTISWWAKWDTSAPHGRFWGQESNFETRWSLGRFVMDFGTDTSLVGTKSIWEVDHWYFFTLTWNQNTNRLAFYWGDEDTEPQLDVEETSWTSYVVGRFQRNAIMNSRLLSDAVDGHIDDFRYYTAERNLDNIRSDYLLKLTGSESNLAHYYRFENNLADTAGTVNLVSSGSFSYSSDVYSILDGWKAEQIEVTVANLQRLYVINGTFESGNPGVNEDWTIGEDGTYYASGWRARRSVPTALGRQRASYVSDEPKYVTLENEGYSGLPDRYRHYNSTRIYWYQSIDNPNLNEEFRFSMNYLYQHGPIGSHFEGSFILRFEILDGQNLLWNWSTDLVNSTQRQVWYGVNPILVNISGAPSSFIARIVLEVNAQSDYVEIDATDTDLDGDSTNGLLVSVRVDDVAFSGVSSLSCLSANLTVGTTEVAEIALSGADGTGTALLNHTYWNKASIPITFSANTTVSFDYISRVLRMTRQYNSTSTANLQDQGVAFSVDLNKSANLTLYTYIQSYVEAENLGFIVYHPNDWENATVLDSFGLDVTEDVIPGSGSHELPMGSVGSVGWWMVTLEGPNYIDSIVSQTRSYEGGFWYNQNSFSTGDMIRAQVRIGTQVNVPSTVLNVRISICGPTGMEWAYDEVTNLTSALVSSNSWTIGHDNATPGEWSISARWMNGSEVAFGSYHYSVCHHLTVFAYTPTIEAELGESVTASVYLYDQDNSNVILGNGATVVGNWSGSQIGFSPNLAKGWWEADFNTSIVGAGDFLVVINATMPFYYQATCNVSIQIRTLTVLTVLSSQYAETSPGVIHEAKIRYMFLDGTGISGAGVSVLSWSGPVGGLSYNSTKSVLGEPGNYTIDFTGTISGTYFITIIAGKPDLSTAAISFYLIVGPVPTNLDVSGFVPPEVLYFNQSYTFSLVYEEAGGGIEGALVNVTYNPVSIVEWTDLGNGRYDISVRVPAIGRYSVYLRFSKLGYEFADISFSFDVDEIPTSLLIYGIAETYYESRVYEFSFYFNSSLGGGVIGAELVPSGPTRDFYNHVISENGWYNFTLTPIYGEWTATFWLACHGYQEQAYSFNLDVLRIPFALSSTFPLNQTYTRTEHSILLLRLSPIETDTQSPVFGALITYILFEADNPQSILIDNGIFIETLGIYSANITVPERGLYVLRITISKTHFEPLIREIVLNSEADPASLAAVTATAALIGALTLFAVVAVVYTGRRYYLSAITKRNLQLLAIKHRFDDAQNLIGVL
ncbi:MAG: hypothetical protein EAX95_14705, partial [Candidatus Thorarchaeota archaeon]|nr:hypothetical protein [Candidatus Thorarchaeota archaeon]